MTFHLYCLHSLKRFRVCLKINLNAFSKLCCFRIQLFPHRPLRASCRRKNQDPFSAGYCLPSHRIVNGDQRHPHKGPDHIDYRCQCRTGHHDHIGSRHLCRLDIVIQAAAVFYGKLPDLIRIIRQEIVPEIMDLDRFPHIILQLLFKGIRYRLYGMDQCDTFHASSCP